MSRIRSIHPGLFTDDDYVELSPFARLLLQAIWTECDDGGCFEWKTKRLKMRLFPADGIDVEELLGELVRNRFAMSYEVDGKKYGAIRNFCKFQRPKKPSRFCPDNEEVRSFTLHGYKAKKSNPKETAGSDGKGGESVGNQFGTGTETAGQKEGKEEGRKEGKEEGIPPKPPKGEQPDLELVSKNEPLPDPFDEFWKVFPKRQGSNPKGVAAKRFSSLTKKGVEPSELINAAKRYAVFCDATGKTRTEKTQMASTWLGEKEGWKQDWTVFSTKPDEGGNPYAKLAAQARAMT